MPICTNLKSLTPLRKRSAREITLLSKGFLSKASFPDGKITVFPWDLGVHDRLNDIRTRETDPERILAQLLPHICDLKGASDFYLSEIMLILMVSHAQGQDGKVTFSTKCPNKSCGHPFSGALEIPEQLEKVAEKDSNWPGYDSVKLPVSGDVVDVKPETLNDLQRLWLRTPAERAIIRDSLYRYCCCIVHVGNGTDKGTPSNLQEAAAYLEALPSEDVKTFIQSIDANSPQLREAVTINCPKCQKEYTSPLPLGFSFFR